MKGHALQKRHIKVLTKQKSTQILKPDIGGAGKAKREGKLNLIIKYVNRTPKLVEK